MDKFTPLFGARFRFSSGVSFVSRVCVLLQADMYPWREVRLRSERAGILSRQMHTAKR